MSLRFNNVFAALMIVSFISAFVVPSWLTDLARVQFAGIFMPVSRPAYHLANLVRGRFVHEDEPDTRPSASIASENLQLRQEVANLQAEVERLGKLAADRQNLGNLNSLCQRVSVTGTDSGNREGLLLAGTVLGDIREGQPVLFSEGLAGRIDLVGVSGAHVMLVTDPAFRVSGQFIRFVQDADRVKAQSIPKLQPIVEGAGNGQMIITNLPMVDVKDAVQRDDWVVLQDTTWPEPVKNIRLGRVASIKPRKGAPLFAEIRLVPESGLSRLSDVWVLTRQR